MYASSEVVWQWQKATIQEARKANILQLQQSLTGISVPGKDDDDWVSYNPENNHNIEQAFQSGSERCRVKCGGVKPMELFLYDKLQYDPVTGYSHNIRRLGTESFSQKTCRLFRSFLYHVRTGSMKHKTFLQYRRLHGLKVEVQTTNRSSGRPPLIKFCRSITLQPWFMPVQMTMILLNAAALGLDADFNNPVTSSSSTQKVFNILDNCFCVFFTGELLIRLGAMDRRDSLQKFLRHLFRNQWFMFDLFLVTMMLLETWVLPLVHKESGLNELSTLRLLRIARLTRLSRIARLLSEFPEIMIMMKSMVSSFKAVLSVFLLLFLMLYIFAIIFKTQAQDSEIEDLFPSIASTMWFLLVHGSFMDSLCASVEAIFSGDPALAVLFMAFLILSNLMVLNMLIGLICEVASEVAELEKRSLEEQLLKLDLAEFFDFFDINGDNLITGDEFDLFLGNPDVKQTLKLRGVDVDSLQNLKEGLFEDDSQISQDELVRVMVRLRKGHGGPATMLDILTLERNLHRSNSEHRELLERSLSMSCTNERSNIVLQESQKMPVEMTREERLYVLCEDMCKQMKLLVSKQDANEASIEDMRQTMLDSTTNLEEKLNRATHDCQLIRQQMGIVTSAPL